MYSAKPGRRQNNNKTEKNTYKDTDTILRSLEIRIKKAKIYPKASNSVNTYFDASWHIRSKKVLGLND